MKWATFTLTEDDKRMLNLAVVLRQQTLQEFCGEAFKELQRKRRMGAAVQYLPVPKRGLRFAVRAEDEELDAFKGVAKKDNVRVGVAYYTAVKALLDKRIKEDPHVFGAI